MSRPMQAPKYNPGDKVIVKQNATGWTNENVRAAIVLAVWYNHREESWTYDITEGADKFMSNHILEKDVLDPYSPSKLIHYVSKGL